MRRRRLEAGDVLPGKARDCRERYVTGSAGRVGRRKVIGGNPMALEALPGYRPSHGHPRRTGRTMTIAARGAVGPRLCPAIDRKVVAVRKPQVGRTESHGRLPTDGGLDLAIVALRAGRRRGPKRRSRLCNTGVAGGAERKEPGVDLVIESGIR